MILKRCTSCDIEKPADGFRLRKIKAPGESTSLRLNTCEQCEVLKNPHSHWKKPAPLWVYTPYEPDAKDADVQRFRRELEQRGIAPGA